MGFLKMLFGTSANYRRCDFEPIVQAVPSILLKKKYNSENFSFSNEALNTMLFPNNNNYLIYMSEISMIFIANFYFHFLVSLLCKGKPPNWDLLCALQVVPASYLTYSFLFSSVTGILRPLGLSSCCKNFPKALCSTQNVWSRTDVMSFSLREDGHKTNFESRN